MEINPEYLESAARIVYLSNANPIEIKSIENRYYTVKDSALNAIFGFTNIDSAYSFIKQAPIFRALEYVKGREIKGGNYGII